MATPPTHNGAPTPAGTSPRNRLDVSANATAPAQSRWKYTAHARRKIRLFYPPGVLSPASTGSVDELILGVWQKYTSEEILINF